MTTAPATQRQIDYLFSLMNRVQHLPDAEAVAVEQELARITANGTPGSKAVASEMISALLRMTAGAPRTPSARPADREPVAAGFYLMDGTVYRVKPNKAGTHTYATELDPTTGRWDYARGVVGRLSAADALTPEEAARRGRHWGRCVFCGDELSNPESVERGIGPVCYRKYC